MAGDWIKMRTDLQTHPKVVRMMSALKADRLRVVGGLHAVWSLFDAHSVDGTLEGYTPEALDSLINWPGFASAMISIHWLEQTGESLTTPRFDEHNGQSAKRRAQESERKRQAREEEKMSATNADKKRAREEKRRDKNICPEATDILAYLNQKAKRDYRAVDSNLRLICARLDEGATVDDCKRVIDSKVEEWLNDAKNAKYLRPETLFNATKFNQYVGQLAAPSEGQSWE